MALNGGAINSHAINSPAGFVSASGGGVVVTLDQIVNALGASTSNIAQLVAFKSTAGVNTTFNQIVEFQQTGSTTITLNQIVASKASKSVAVDQLVVAVSEPTTFFGRNGYEPRIYIGGNKVSDDDLHGNISCTFTEGDAPQLKFTIIPATGSQDIRSYRGKTVEMFIRGGTTTTRVYTGKINTPDVLIIDQKISFNCSLDLEQVVNNTLGASELQKIGYYNNKVFSKPKTTLQELRDRVSTVPKTIVVDRAATVDVVNIAPKGTADYTLTDADIYRRDISFKFSSGQRYINKVNIKMSYAFQRLHHQEIGYATLSPHNTVCQLLIGGYTTLSRQLVYSAVQSSNWPVKGDIIFSDIYADGYYHCGDATVGWSTISCTGTTTPTGATTDGDEQLGYNATACTNIRGTICKTASWTATNRHAQNIDNEYTLTVEAPQSQADFGIKEKDDNFSLADKFNSGGWEDYQAYTTSIPSGTSVKGTQGANFWIDANTEVSAFNTSIDILLNRAKSSILKSHRDDRVLFRRSLWTDITLKDTVFVDTARVTAKGKVYSYTHTINVNTGEATTSVELALSRSTGSATDSVLSIPAAPVSTPVYSTSNINLPGHYGEDPTLTSGSGDWVGHIANKMITTYTNGKPDLRMTQYPVRFVYDTPEVGANLREGSELTTSASYDVAIPDDTLTINFTDTNYE